MQLSSIWKKIIGFKIYIKERFKIYNSHSKKKKGANHTYKHKKEENNKYKNEKHYNRKGENDRDVQKYKIQLF